MSRGLDIAGVAVFDDPASIRATAERLTSVVRAVHATAAEIQVRWSHLAGAYQAPEQQQVLAAMTPPSEVALRLSERVATAEAALMAYADRLVELEAMRRALVLDMVAFAQERAGVEAANADNTAWDTVVDHYRAEAVDLARREDGLYDRVLALQVAKDQAENECVNAMGDLWGAPAYHLTGETSVHNPYTYGSTASGYDQLTRSGRAPWNAPASWSSDNWDVRFERIDQGARDTVLGIKDTGFDLLGVNGEGRAAASRSATVQLAGDAWTFGSWVGFLTADDAERRESAQRLGQAGVASTGYGTWSHDGWHTAGGFAPDAMATAATGGLFAAPRFGARAAQTSGLPDAVPGTGLPPGRLPMTTTVAGHEVPPVDWGKHAEIGKDYPATMRATVAPILDRAAAAEPAVTRAFLESLPDGARPHGLEHRIKSPDSLASKIQREEERAFLATPPIPNDVLRYTSVVRSDTHLIASAQTVVENLRADGWVVSKAHHSYVAGNRYKGIHCTMTSPDHDTAVELQFHSEASIDVKEQTRGTYEIVRDRDRPMSQRLQAEGFAQSLNDSLESPHGIESFDQLGGVDVSVKTYPPSDW